MKKMLFVFNPNSGKAQIKKELIKILQIFSTAGYEVTAYPTKAPLDGYCHILETEGMYDVIACSGGDGTLNETVSAIMKFTTPKPPIGYIPSGSTNDFATSLGIPKNMIKAAELIAKGKLFPCDIGLANGEKTFNYVAAFGAFTAVSYATPQNLKNVLGHAAYLLRATTELKSLKAKYYKIHSKEKSCEGRYLLGMVSNTMSVGGFKGVTGKEVDLQDGLFEIMLVKELNNPIAVESVIKAFLTRRLQECKYIEYWKTNKITVASKNETPWTLDGEFGGDYNKLTLEVKEQAVDFIVK